MTCRTLWIIWVILGPNHSGYEVVVQLFIILIIICVLGLASATSFPLRHGGTASFVFVDTLWFDDLCDGN